MTIVGKRKRMIFKEYIDLIFESNPSYEFTFNDTTSLIQNVEQRLGKLPTDFIYCIHKRNNNVSLMKFSRARDEWYTLGSIDEYEDTIDLPKFIELFKNRKHRR